MQMVELGRELVEALKPYLECLPEVLWQ